MKTLLIIVLSFFALSSFAATPVEKEWTFMVFLNGDNNLYGSSIKDIEEMVDAGENSQVNVIVLHDTGAHESTKILSITKNGPKVIFDYKKNLDTGDYKNLVSFFKYVKQNYPAKRFVIDIWNHGNGWLDNTPSPVNSDKGISYDDSSGHFITTLDLGVALSEIKKLNNDKNIEVLGMDACLMSMAEVAYEVNDSVNYVLGSEETEADDGWNYTATLKSLMSNPKIETEMFLKEHVKAYVDQYTDGATQSAISIEKLKNTTAAFKAFVAYAKTVSAREYGAFAQARNNTRKFDEPSYKDGINFFDLLSSKTKDAKLKNLAIDVSFALKSSVLYSQQKGLSGSNGIAIWLPDGAGQDYDAYKKLKWASDSSWLDLLQVL